MTFGSYAVAEGSLYRLQGLLSRRDVALESKPRCGIKHGKRHMKMRMKLGCSRPRHLKIARSFQAALKLAIEIPSSHCLLIYVQAQGSSHGEDIKLVIHRDKN